jgi:hypothetical protein
MCALGSSAVRASPGAGRAAAGRAAASTHSKTPQYTRASDRHHRAPHTHTTYRTGTHASLRRSPRSPEAHTHTHDTVVASIAGASSNTRNRAKRSNQHTTQVGSRPAQHKQPGHHRDKVPIQSTSRGRTAHLPHCNSHATSPRPDVLPRPQAWQHAHTRTATTPPPHARRRTDRAEILAGEGNEGASQESKGELGAGVAPSRSAGLRVLEQLFLELRYVIPDRRRMPIQWRVQVWVCEDRTKKN